MGLKESNICDLMWTCGRLAHLAKFLATSSSWWSYLMARHYALKGKLSWKPSSTGRISGNFWSWRLLLLSWRSFNDFLSVLESHNLLWQVWSCALNNISLPTSVLMTSPACARTVLQTPAPLNVLTISLAVTLFRLASKRHFTGRSVRPGVWKAWQ